MTGTLTLTGGLYKYTTPQKVAYNFNSAGDLATIVYPNGVTVTLAYTAGALTSITNGMGRTLTLSYTGALLTSVSDGTGRSVSYVVDGSSNLTQFTDANGKLTTYSYGSPGLLTQMFPPQNPTNALFTNTYDSLGRVMTQADGLSNLSTYRFAGSRSQQTDPVGNNTVWYFNRFGDITAAIDALGNTTVNVFDGLRRLSSKTLPEGNKFSYLYDNLNNVLQVTAQPKSGSPLANIVNVYSYDATYNKVHTAQDGRGNTTTYNFDAATGNLLNIQRPLVGGLAPTVTFTYNGRGQVLTRTDETGIVTQFNYDTTTEKLLSKVVDFGISPHLNLTTQYGYNTVGDVTSIIDARSNTTTFLVDLLRRTTQKTDPTPFSYVTKWTYDDNNQLIKVERQTGDALNPWQTTLVGYSLTGKRKTVTDPSNNVFTYVYDTADRLWKLTDAENRTYQAAYDTVNRISQITDPTSVVAEMRTYTVNGRLYQLTDARGNTTSYSFDGFDRPDRETFPDSSYEQQQSYDGNSNILTFRTRSGNTIVNTFDALNRLATRTPQGQPVVTLTYDLAGRLLKSNKPTVVGDPSTGDFQFFYDAAGRAYKEQYPDAKTVVHVLDNNGNITKTTWPDAYFVDRVYDQINRLTDIKLNGAGTSAANFQYDPLTRRKTLTLSNGVVTTYAYELDDDAASLLHTFNGSNVSFTYGSNKVHQLTSQNVSDGLFIWHPAVPGTTTYGTANNLNQYPTVGGVAQAFNTNGCLTGDGTWTFGYDTENHLLTAVKTGVSASYVYDPMHRQAQKVVGSAKTRYIYSGWQRIADYDGVANTLQNRYVHGTDMDEPIIQVASSGTLSFLHQERQGSVVALTSNTGVVSNRYSYSPFGESAVMTGTTFGYQGQRFDAETGLYYFKARHYSPVTGRFLQPDVIGYRGGFNLYTFVLNDPLNRADPYGLAPTTNPQQNRFVPGGGGVSLPPPDAAPPTPSGFSISPPSVPAPIGIYAGMPSEGNIMKLQQAANRPTIHMAEPPATPPATPPDTTPPNPTPPKDPDKGDDEDNKKKSRRNTDNRPDPESEARLKKAVDDAQRARDIRDGARDSRSEWENDLTENDRSEMRQKFNELTPKEFDKWMAGKYLNPFINPR